MRRLVKRRGEWTLRRQSGRAGGCARARRPLDKHTPKALTFWLNQPDKAVADDVATEARILDAAQTVFVRRGVDGARTQEIADEAGVNKALLHYYFRTKDRLAEAVFKRIAGAFFPRVLAAFATDVSLEERVRQVVALETDFLARHPFLPGYLLGEMRARPEAMKTLVRAVLPIDRMREAVRTNLQAALDAEAAAGRMRPLRAEEFVVNLIGWIVFPYAARPMLELVLGMEGPALDDFLDSRNATLADAYLRSLQP